MIKLFLCTVIILILGEFTAAFLAQIFKRDRAEVLAIMALSIAATALAVNVL